MSKHSFTDAERFAVYVTHGEKCYLCNQPVDLKTMAVDHVIPEWLLADPPQLAAVLKALGRPDDFSIQSYANWMPACSPCNGKKLGAVFEPTPIIQLVLQTCAVKAAKAASLEKQVLSRKKIARALNVLQRVHEAGELDEPTKAALVLLVPFQEKQRAPELVGQPIRFTPHYEVIYRAGGIEVVQGPYGVGGRPAAPNPHSSFDCPTCGAGAAFNGARCVRCGTLSDE